MSCAARELPETRDRDGRGIDQGDYEAVGRLSDRLPATDVTREYGRCRRAWQGFSGTAGEAPPCYNVAVEYALGLSAVPTRIFRLVITVLSHR
jgi:hypothetical protein